MARLITGRFDDVHECKHAISALANEGFARHQYGVFYVTPPGQHDRHPVGGDSYRDAGTADSGPGAVAGAAMGGGAGLAVGAIAAVAFPVAGGLAMALAGTGVGAYVGSLIGAMSQAEHPEPDEGSKEHPVEQPGGVRIAINVDDGGEKRARLALETAGAQDIAEAEGKFEDREWKDFDPRVPPDDTVSDDQR